MLSPFKQARAFIPYDFRSCELKYVLGQSSTLVWNSFVGAHCCRLDVPVERLLCPVAALPCGWTGREAGGGAEGQR